MTKKNLLFYSKENIINSITEEVTLPYCICLPLYCIKNLNKDFDPDNINYVDEMTLPEKCQNNLKFYENGVNEKNLLKITEINTYNVKLRKGE